MVNSALGTTNTLLSVFAPTNDICYTVGTEVTILKTDNGGVTWVAQLSGTTMNMHSVFFTDISNRNVTWRIWHHIKNHQWRCNLGAGAKWIRTLVGVQYFLSMSI